MKHWDERERTDGAPARLSPRERQRLREMWKAPPQPRRQSATGSLIGLTLAVTMVAALAWLLSPGSPVSPKLID